MVATYLQLTISIMAKSKILLLALSAAILMFSSTAFASDTPPTLNLDFFKLDTSTEEAAVDTPPTLNFNFVLEEKTTERPPSLSFSFNFTEVKENTLTPPSLSFNFSEKIGRVSTQKIKRIPSVKIKR